MKLIDQWDLPLALKSEANDFSHWRIKDKRKQVLKMHFKLCALRSKIIPLPVTVEFTRISPRFLDEEDNLRIAFKTVKDYVADFLIPGKRMGQADSDKRIKWKYNQEKGKPQRFTIKYYAED
jgi:hypothetical protein